MADEDGNLKTTDDNDGTPEEKGQLAALQEERRRRQDAERRAARAEGQVQGLTTVAAAKPAIETPKELSAAELRQHVDEGRLSEGDADRIRETQIERRVTATVSKEAEANAAATAINTRVQDGLDRYRAAIPGIDTPGSDERLKIEREYQYLKDHGSPENLGTQLAAARAAFGDLAKLEKIADPKPRETFGETGGHADPNTDGGNRADGSPKGMSQELRAHYSKRIDSGMYKGWDDPVLQTEINDFGDRTRGNAAARSRAAA